MRSAVLIFADIVTLLSLLRRRLSKSILYSLLSVPLTRVSFDLNFLYAGANPLLFIVIFKAAVVSLERLYVKLLALTK